MGIRPSTPEMRRYVVRLFILMLLYAVSLWLAVTGFREAPPTGIAAYILALAPAVPIIGIFWTIGRLIVETEDEYQRMLLVKQTLVGTGLTLAVATAWGFLERFDLAPRPEGFFIAMLWFAMWGVASALVRLRA